MSYQFKFREDVILNDCKGKPVKIEKGTLFLFDNGLNGDFSISRETFDSEQREIFFPDPIPSGKHNSGRILYTNNEWVLSLTYQPDSKRQPNLITLPFNKLPDLFEISGYTNRLSQFDTFIEVISDGSSSSFAWLNQCRVVERHNSCNSFEICLCDQPSFCNPRWVPLDFFYDKFYPVQTSGIYKLLL